MTFICSGDQFFEEMWRLIDESNYRCWILTYHFKNSEVANKTIQKLIEASERGVNVALYVDWLNFSITRDQKKRLADAKVEIYTLNPMFPWQKGFFTKEIFRRYHQKMFLADDTVIIGSSNIDDHYAGPKYGKSTFQDLNILVKNPKLANQAKHNFLLIKQSFLEQKIEIDETEEYDDNFEILASDVGSFKYDIQERILSMIENAKNRIILVQGYYAKIKKMDEAIGRALDRGVKVEVITSKKRDQPVYQNLKNYSLLKPIRPKGAVGSEYIGSVLHMKAYIIDDAFCLGSFNHDKWSWNINKELNIFSKEKALTEELLNHIDRIKSRCIPITKTRKDFILDYIISKFWKVSLYLTERLMNTKRQSKCYLPDAYIEDKISSIEERFNRKKTCLSTFKLSLVNIF